MQAEVVATSKSLIGAPLEHKGPLCYAAVPCLGFLAQILWPCSPMGFWNLRVS